MASEVEIERMVVRLLGDTSRYKKALKDAEAATAKYTRGIDGKLRDAQGKFVSDQRLMAEGLADTATKLRVVGAAMKKVGDGMVRVGKRASLFVTAPLIAMGAAATKAFADFDRAMTESTSIMDVTAQQTMEMRNAALSLSEEAIQGPEELAKSYFFLASAGKSAEQSIALLPKVAEFATAGAFDMALATDLLTDAQSALGLSSKNVAEDTENMARVADVLVKANTLANASVQQFAESLTNETGAALKVLNKDVEEGVAVLAAYADQGVKGQVAGSQLARVMRLLSKAALDNAEEHERLGFSVFDANGKMRNMADIVQNLEEVTAGMSDETRAATLDMLGFQARVQNAILPLLGTSSAIRQYEMELRRAGGTTSNVAQNQMKSFTNQMKLVKNQVTVAAIEIGQVLAPMLARLAEKLKGLIQWWRSLDQGTKEWVVTIALVVATVGPALIILGTLASSIGHLIPLFTTMKSLVMLTTAATRALAATSWGLHAALAGIAALGIAAVILGIRNALAETNREAEMAIQNFKRMADKRLKQIEQLEGSAQSEAVQQEMTRRENQLLEAQRQFDKERARLEGEGRFANALRQGAGAIFGADSLDSLKKELEANKAELQAVKDLERRIGEKPVSRDIKNATTAASAQAPAVAARPIPIVATQGPAAQSTTGAPAMSTQERIAIGIETLVAFAEEESSRELIQVEPIGL